MNLSVRAPRPPPDFGCLLARRATCRNFDATKRLPHALFAQLLERVFSTQAEVRVSDDTVFLKKTSPSGGGLHPMEAYLIVQHVDGVAPGLYHYQAGEHALEPMPAPAAPLREFVMDMVAQQHCFADAHALLLLSPRFDRSWPRPSWASALVTSAINEVDIELAFGLDPLAEGPLAICGFGWRNDRMDTAEFDPAGAVWQPEMDASLLVANPSE